MGTAFLALVLPFVSSASAGDDYTKMAEDLAEAARRAGVRRLAVAPLEAIGGADAQGTAVVGDRVMSRLSAQSGVQLVERALLERVFEEQRLSQSGAVVGTDAVLIGRLAGVEAIVIGRLVRRTDRKVEVNLRLIHAADARVLGAATADVRPDWPQGDQLDDRHPAPAPPRLPVEFPAFWETPESDECRGWQSRVGALQSAALPFLIRHWAALLASGFDVRGLTRNPGSDIRSSRTRSAFYNGVRDSLESGGFQPLSAEEASALSRAESTVRRLTQRCE